MKNNISNKHSTPISIGRYLLVMLILIGTVILGWVTLLSSWDELKIKMASSELHKKDGDSFIDIKHVLTSHQFVLTRNQNDIWLKGEIVSPSLCTKISVFNHHLYEKDKNKNYEMSNTQKQLINEHCSKNINNIKIYPIAL